MNDNLIQVEYKNLVQNFLNDAVLNYQVKNASYIPGRIVLFVVFGKGKEAKKYLDKIELFASSIFTSGACSCVLANDEKQDYSEQVINAIGVAARSHTVQTAAKLLMVPIVIQESTELCELDNSFDILKKFCTDVSEKLENRMIDVLWLPSAVFFDKYIKGKSVEDFKKRLFEAMELATCGTVNAVLYLGDRDSQNFEIRGSAIVRSLVMTAFVFCENTHRISNVECNGNKYFYASSFSLQMPVHVEILKRAKRILDEFLKMPEDHDERMKRFGKAVSSLPKEKFWRSTWTQLPITQNDDISIAPLHSFLSYGDGSKDSMHIKSFSEKYYLSKLPIEGSTMYSDDFLSSFWTVYKSEYGRSITGIGDIFETGKSSNFIYSNIEDLNVSHLYLSVSNNTDYNSKKQFIIDESKRLEQALTNRIRDFYSAFLNEKNPYIKDICNMHKRSVRFVELVREILIGEIQYWQAEEITHGLFSDNFDVTQNMLNDLLDSYVEMLKRDANEASSESPRIKERDFVKKIFDHARTGYRVDASDYLKTLEDSSINGSGEIVKNCYDRVKKFLLSDDTWKREYHIILDNPERSELSKSFCEKNDPFATSDNVVHIVDGVHDRFYLTCLTEPKEMRVLSIKKGE